MQGNGQVHKPTDHSSYANSTAAVHKFHHYCIFTEFAIRYADTEFRMHYKLGVLSFTLDIILKMSVAASTILHKYIQKFSNMKAQAYPADKLCNDYSLRDIDRMEAITLSVHNPSRKIKCVCCF
jgi:lysyl-tRNA synthetase class I